MRLQITIPLFSYRVIATPLTHHYLTATTDRLGNTDKLLRRPHFTKETKEVPGSAAAESLSHRAGDDIAWTMWSLGIRTVDLSGLVLGSQAATPEWIHVSDIAGRQHCVRAQRLQSWTWPQASPPCREKQRSSRRMITQWHTLTVPLQPLQKLVIILYISIHYILTSTIIK